MEKQTKKDENKQSIRDIFNNNKLMLGYFLRYTPGYFHLYTFYTVLVSAVNVITSTLSIKILLDALQNGVELKKIFIFLLSISTMMIVRNLLGSYIVEYLEPVASVTLQEKLRTEIFTKASKMDLVCYENPEFYNDFVWAATQTDRKIYAVFSSYLYFIAHISSIIFLGGVMLVLNPVLIVLALIAVTLNIVINKKVIKMRFDIETEIKPFERERDYSQRVFYLSDYAKEIRLSSVHKVLYKRFKNANHKIRQITNQKSKKIVALNLLLNFTQESLLTLSVLLYLTYQIAVAKSISIGDFAALIIAVQKFASVIRWWINSILRFSENSLYINKYKKFLAYEPKIEEHVGKELNDQISEICFENVSFTYAGGSEASLKNISMTIQPCQKIAIVGYNGAGKSTLIKLLLRLYDVSEGAIYLGKTNINEYTTKLYRSEFGTVFQDFQIFAASIGENVAMGDVAQEDKSNIEAVLNNCGMGEKIEKFDNGIDRQLTKEFFNDGTNLSGGESQKVAISRAFFKPFKYIIMDEPSSALDPISEYQLNQKIIELAKDKTIIFISHRLSTTCMADCIYMFEKGEIIESGTHKQLMEKNNKYAEMFRTQAQNYQLEVEC